MDVLLQDVISSRILLCRVPMLLLLLKAQYKKGMTTSESICHFSKAILPDWSQLAPPLHYLKVDGPLQSITIMSTADMLSEGREVRPHSEHQLWSEYRAEQYV